MQKPYGATLKFFYYYFMTFKHRNHSWSLVVTRGHSWSLVVTRGHSWSLVVTRGHSWSLVVTRGHSWSLVVIRGHSWSLVVTRGHSCVLLDKIVFLRVQFFSVRVETIGSCLKVHTSDHE